MKTAVKRLSWTLALGCASALATDRPPDIAQAASAARAPISNTAANTGINERDKSGATSTPQDQTNRPQDRELLAAVRRAVVGDKSLSTMAHNVKILVEGGAVTLRGPVKNAGEKAKVESLAKNVKGITSADNQLDVSAKPSTNQ